MHITIAAIGSRGDVQPYLALARGLKAAGHSVAMVAGENFRGWITGMGIDFAPIIDMEALMNTPDGRKWVEQGDSSAAQLRQMRWVADQIAPSATHSFTQLAQETDLFLTGLAGEGYLHAIAEKFGTRVMGAALQPYQRSRLGAATLNGVTSGSNPLNWWYGTMVARMLFDVYRPSISTFRAELQLPPPHLRDFTKRREAMPFLYGVSRHVVPRAPEWNAESHRTGYWFHDQPDYQPPQTLLDFLQAGDPPVSIGFGSMASSDPYQTFALFTQALGRAGRRGVIITGWNRAALQGSDTIHVLEQAPHDWLFPRMAAVVHHGGAGTTAAGLRAGKPSLLIPHMGDQPYWGRRIAELGVGAKPISRQRLTVSALAEAITAITGDAAMIERAGRLGEQIRAENGVEEAVQRIEQYMARGVTR